MLIWLFKRLNFAKIFRANTETYKCLKIVSHLNSCRAAALSIGMRVLKRPILIRIRSRKYSWAWTRCKLKKSQSEHFDFWYLINFISGLNSVGLANRFSCSLHCLESKWLMTSRRYLKACLQLQKDLIYSIIFFNFIKSIYHFSSGYK